MSRVMTDKADMVSFVDMWRLMKTESQGAYVTQMICSATPLNMKPLSRASAVRSRVLPRSRQAVALRPRTCNLPGTKLSGNRRRLGRTSQKYFNAFRCWMWIILTVSLISRQLSIFYPTAVEYSGFQLASIDRRSDRTSANIISLDDYLIQSLLHVHFIHSCVLFSPPLIWLDEQRFVCRPLAGRVIVPL